MSLGQNKESSSKIIGSFLALRKNLVKTVSEGEMDIKVEFALISENDLDKGQIKKSKKSKP